MIARIPLVRRATLVAACFAWLAGAARAGDLVTGVVIERPTGRARTRESTVRSVLPAELPAELRDEEIEEIDRRLRNLEIFDDVAVERRGEVLAVRLREKFTLRPDVALSTGRTLKDSYVLLGLTELNALGTGTRVSAWASWEQRGPNGGVSFAQHPWAPRRWMRSGELGYAVTDVRFDEASTTGWEQRATMAWLGWTPPLAYFHVVRPGFGPFVNHDAVADVRGAARPPTGVWLGAWADLTFDRWVFHDLVPRGVRAIAECAAGWLVGEDAAVVLPNATVFLALPPTSWLVLTSRLKVEGLGGRAVGWAPVLGSQSGVRGLPESLYRSRVQAYANVELRASWQVATRLALQGALFGDAGVFRAFTANGSAAPADFAASAGAGARIVPTFLAGLILRVDVARLYQPSEAWLVQLGFSQYF